MYLMNQNSDDDGVSLYCTAHPLPKGLSRLYWTIRYWWNAATWPIRRLWLTETIEIDTDQC
jgi:hypothetical protein